jgi:hypothetical protein
MLNATACETMPHCGMTLATVRNSLFAIADSAIARNYSVHDVACCNDRDYAVFCAKVTILLLWIAAY